jgi:tripartite-type tricarboxylate transporter receptor subunit TctC
MKNILASLALAAVTLTATAQTPQNVTIFYGWNAADVAANFHRTLATEANSQQKKYNFIFDVKPGAGAAIAAMYVEKTPNTILATSSAFWIRPNFFPKESHQVENFRELMPACDAPLTMVSKKYKSVKEIPTDRPLNVGVSGLGITTHLVAVEVAKKYPNMNIIPFKSTNEAMLATLGGQTDFSVNFVGDSYQYVTSKEEKNRLYMMGVTGQKSVLNTKPFIEQGFDNTLSYMNAPAHLVAPKTMPEAQFKEIREIFVKAGRSQTVLDSYKADFCAPLNQMSDEQIDPWFAASNARWKRLTSTITLK